MEEAMAERAGTKRRIENNGKLSVDEKVEIATSGAESLRSLGDRHGVHHSTAAEIKSEGEEVLRGHFQAKSSRTGRPSRSSAPEDGEVEALRRELERLGKENAMLAMRLDHANLMIKFANENDLKFKGDGSSGWRPKRHLKKTRRSSS